MTEIELLNIKIKALEGHMIIIVNDLNDRLNRLEDKCK